MAKQSLFSACKRVFRDGISGTYTVGNNDIFLELYSQQDIDQNNEIGNSSEENIVVVAGDTITIPEGYTLTPVKPKKSLVVICNTFVNNGTVSMYQKAPNVLPHDFYIIGKQDSYDRDIIISAYANNAVSRRIYVNNETIAKNGNNGTNRQCGSGGTGGAGQKTYTSSIQNLQVGASGSGYAFGGGAGSGGATSVESSPDVDTTYPMRGGDSCTFTFSTGGAVGGVGNPVGLNHAVSNTGANNKRNNNFGCGGRIIIFCNNFNNNGNITVNGTDTKQINKLNYGGGASGAGAIDLFYTNLLKQGTITATGGNTYLINNSYGPGKGGDGSITLTPWTKSSVLKPIAKYMSKENMIYFLTNYIQRLKQGED